LFALHHEGDNEELTECHEVDEHPAQTQKHQCPLIPEQQHPHTILICRLLLKGGVRPLLDSTLLFLLELQLSIGWIIDA